MKTAQQKIETDSLIECVSTLPTQSKIVLYSMIILSDLKTQVFTTGEVSQVYHEVAQILDIDVLTHRRITDLISELNMLGVINTRVVSRGRYGRTKEMWFGTTTERIKETLLKDSRFENDKLKNLDTNRFKTPFR